MKFLKPSIATIIIAALGALYVIEYTRQPLVILICALIIGLSGTWHLYIPPSRRPPFWIVIIIGIVALVALMLGVNINTDPYSNLDNTLNAMSLFGRIGVYLVFVGFIHMCYVRLEQKKKW